MGIMLHVLGVHVFQFPNPDSAFIIRRVRYDALLYLKMLSKTSHHRFARLNEQNKNMFYVMENTTTKTSSCVSEKSNDMDVVTDAKQQTDCRMPGS